MGRSAAVMPMVSAPLDVVPDGVGAGAGGDEVASLGSTRPGTQHPPRAMRSTIDAGQGFHHVLMIVNVMRAEHLADHSQPPSVWTSSICALRIPNPHGAG
ncbi:hypothetical protein BSA16_08535 [Micromonospora sp. Rc5]|nr:hypothetical protein BSA16_08535 [Micromonospora sp. Rc5]